MSWELPDRISVREVGPRDGLQNEDPVPTDAKVALLDRLSATGVQRIEAVSFVRPSAIPQMADADEVWKRAARAPSVRYSALVPNLRGALRALDSGFTELEAVVSASETHNRKNVNRSIAESLAGLEVVLGRARAEGLRCEGVISTAFGCPYEGRVPSERVLDVAASLRDAGAQEIGFGDTTGMANPRQVGELFAQWREGLPGVELTAHFHNTRGQGLANVIAALEAGVESFESSFGELGGCPVPAGATGNIASEDLVSMLQEMGIETGIDLDALVECARQAQEVLGRPLGSHTLVAGPVEWGKARGGHAGSGEEP
jgi:hydroxymethylglutaryl-CoA lyase